MPKNPMKGTKQVLMELPEGFVQDVKTFAMDRGQTFKDVTIEALKRHMAYPPPKPEPPKELPPVPLPDVQSDGKKPAPKKGKAK